MKIGLHVPNFGAFADPGTVADLAASAEAAGWDGFFLWDHVARPEGTFPMLDPWIALAAVAMRTGRMRIGPLVTPLARRRSWNVARQVVTLDHLSHGRVTLGIGLGVSTGPEFRSFGEQSDPKTRGDMLDEGLEILHGAWRGTPVRHEGIHYRLDSVTFLPPPAQPSVPIWGATERVSGRRLPGSRGAHSRRCGACRSCWRRRGRAPSTAARPGVARRPGGPGAP